MSNIRIFEFELRNKFLPYRKENKSTSMSNNFKVDLYLVIGHIGLI